MNDRPPDANPFAAGAAFVGGKFVPVAEACVPLLDWGFLRSDACQDTVSVWKGAFFRLDDHLVRFERSWRALRMTCPYSAAELKRILATTVLLTGLGEAYLQMIMTRGRPPIGSRDPRRAENRFYLFCIPYVWIATPEVQKRGLSVKVSDIRRVPAQSVDPQVKHYHWLDFEMGLFEAYDAGADTVVLRDLDGNIAEGPGFNIFAVKDGEMVTPARGVLDGMTRTTVFELAEELNVQARLGELTPAALAGADEVFLSTTAGGVLPVTTVDGRPVGDGRPGPTTLRLGDLYWRKRNAGWKTTPVAELARTPWPGAPLAEAVP